MRRLFAVLLVPMFLGACGTSSSDTYDAEDVGKVLSTAEGTVLSSREVEIEGSTGPVGALAGGAAGGATGYGLTGGSGPITVLGALVGAGAGYLAESTFNDRDGYEYVVRMDDGRVVTLVQNRGDQEEPIKDGAPVLVQYGDTYTRIIPLPQNLGSTAPGASGTWINPDTLPPGQKPPGSLVDSDTPADTTPRASGGSGQQPGTGDGSDTY
ncbi:MAG: hypothetical protein QNJ30_01725 [Kiloniellales bacterium]|nr:hypothetical protein [Kiloniellales bacterium]